MTNTVLHAKPWYREPWPWFLMSLPATAVAAGLTTVWIAYQSADGLVVGDYYKEGLAINQPLERDAAARTLAHPTHQGMDHTLTLHYAGGGRYRATLPAMPDGKWHAQLTDAASTWRLAGVLHSPFTQAITLSSDSAVQQPQGE